MVVGLRSIRVGPFLVCLVLLIGTGYAQGVAKASNGDRKSSEDFWAFRPIGKPSVPQPKDGAWAKTDVDRFILARVEAAGLQKAGPASARSLIRRLTFDLTGLPPKPADIDAFVRDSSDEAYDALVDRLLASPAFGEKWGRHWLDVARFAESSGGGRSLMFENAWRFRDYVIDSYIRDVPFDRFITEQIAGDLLPFDDDEQRNRQLVGAGFLELGPTNYELQDKELLRMEVIDEQIDTVGRAFMGLTLGCARCHDHKFDPIPTTDYYALAGIFGSTQVLTAGNVSGHVEQEFLGTRTRKWRAYQKRIGEIETRLKKLRPNKSKRAKQRQRNIVRPGLQGIVLDDEEAQRTGVWIPSTHAPGYLDLGYIHDENTEKGEKSVRFQPRILKSGVYEVRLSYTSGSNRATNVPVRIDHASGKKIVHVNQRSAPEALDSFVTLGRFRFLAGKKGAVTITNDDTDGHVIVDAVQWIAVEKLAGGRPSKRLADPRVAAEIRRLESELAKLKKAAPPKPMRAMAVRDVANPDDGHVHVRGQVRKKGERVPRGFVTACGGTADIPDGESGRLQLARWLASPSHPLTTRVYVNRVWHWLFGTGLVRTTDNFGKMGERPSHLELLDWLAQRFITDDRSTKKLVRLLVRSSTYRMAVGPSLAADADNRLLSHANRRRLDAEALRDTILWISGRLDPKRGGKTIRKMSQYDYNYVFESRRRSVYVPRFRSNRMEIFDVFDAANPNTVTGARNVSNVAPQALYLMNSPWVMEQAEHAAAKLISRGEMPVDARLDSAYSMTVGRPPSVAERRVARRYLAKFAGDERSAWTRLFHTLFACVDFRYVD